MKKFLFTCLILVAVGFAASAQTEKTKSNEKKSKVESTTKDAKVKKTSTPKQKVHNVIHRKNKQYSGVKVKGEVKKDQ